MYRLLFIFALALPAFSCNSEVETRFVLLDPAATGVDFVNELNATPELNILNYLYFYDGGGVAAGDLNGNGLPDLYFAANQGPNRLYLNRGDFTFEDVTDRAFDVPTDTWSNGVTLVDVNGDGLLDVYVLNVGGYMHFDGRNQLFVNQGNDENGIPIFKEQAADYGLDLVGLATQAVFFDYDLDGDLDLFVMNHSVHEFGTFTHARLRQERHSLAGDRLFRNDGGTFVEVTREAGIYSSALGYGLGVGIGDLTGNGYPDVYVGNDFHEDDYLYVNNGDGTFTESLAEMIRYTSYSSMGNDLVDVNNDGLIDIVSLDMLPEDYEKLKTSYTEDPIEIANLKRSYGYKEKYSRNTLQLNRGNGKFSEIGMLAGIHATDWSWAVLGADFDNSGYVDLFITNGIYRRTNDLDYTHFISQEAIQQRIRGDLTEQDVRLADRAPAVNVPNYLFKNHGELVFADVARKWGLGRPSFSSGAVYADLNGDGDLDLVVNNVNQVASIYRNMTRERYPHSNYLKVRFHGPVGNTHGIGARIRIPRGEEHVIVRELYPTRGFQSSVEPILHVGLDSLAVVPELIATWPGGRMQTLRNVPVNQTLTIEWEDAREPEEAPPPDRTPTIESESARKPDDMSAANRPVRLFEEITESLDVPYRHHENNFNEFNREALIPHMVSREGPALAVGDVNGDGLEDFFVGGAKRQKGSLFLQQPDGTFKEQPVPAFEDDFVQEDVDAHFADFTGDGRLDLLVVSGGNEYAGTSEFMLPRLYVNDGHGNFTRAEDRLPKTYLTGSVAAVGDVTGSGLPDVFLGARAVPWNYGVPPVSYLLINRGGGFFEIDTTAFGKRFNDLGLVTGARWADMNGDGRLDLVVASEWSNLRIVYNAEEAVHEIPGSSGLWSALAVVDLNGNGRPDVLAGNLGLNSKLKASEEAPLRMYVDDFDGNGWIDQIITYVDRDGVERLFASKDELGAQLNYVNERFSTYQAFARASLYDVVERRLMRRATLYRVDELRSAVFYNEGDGFSRVSLPITSQFAPIRDFLVADLNDDGYPDVVAVGNFFEAAIQRGRYGADYGNVLLNDGQGRLRHLPNHEIDWFLDGQIRRIDLIHVGEAPVMIVAANDEPLRFFEVRVDPGDAGTDRGGLPLTASGDAGTDRGGLPLTASGGGPAEPGFRAETRAPR